MPMDFELKDSGARTEFKTGSVRDLQVGKGRFDLIPVEPLIRVANLRGGTYDYVAYPGMMRVARLYEKGSIKYVARNWEKGQPFSACFNSMMRHQLKHISGWRDEDHAAAVVFNSFAIMTFEVRIGKGLLPKDLDDIPRQADINTTSPVSFSRTSRDLALEHSFLWLLGDQRTDHLAHIASHYLNYMELEYTAKIGTTPPLCDYVLENDQLQEP